MRTHLPVLAILGFGLSAPQLFAKQFYAERFDVHLRLTEANVLEVRETARFHFSGGSFTYAYRNIRWSNADGVDFIEAALDGVRCEPGRGNGQVEVTGASPVRVRWNFAPTIDSTRTVTLRYNVRGPVRRTASGDTIVWHVLPEKRDYGIGASEIRVVYPVEPQTLTLDGVTASIERQSGSIVARSEALSRKADAVLTARFTAGSLIGAPPQWQEKQGARRRDILLGLLYGGIAGIVILAAFGAWLKRIPRGPAIGEIACSEPPRMRPAIAAVLAGRPATAAPGILMDLTRRGILRIEEESARWGRSFRVKRTGAAHDLAPHEALLLETAFPKSESEVALPDYASRVQGNWGRIGSAIQTELEAAGFVDPELRQVRQKVKTIAVMTFIGALIVLAMAAAMRSDGDAFGFLLALTATAFIAGILAAVTVSNIAPWTLAGAEQAARARACARYVTELARGRTSSIGVDFERWLPFAAAIGLGSAFARQWRDQAVPEWCAAFQSGDDGGALVAVIASCDSGSAGGDGGASGGDSGAG